MLAQLLILSFFGGLFAAIMGLAARGTNRRIDDLKSDLVERMDKTDDRIAKLEDKLEARIETLEEKLGDRISNLEADPADLKVSHLEVKSTMELILGLLNTHFKLTPRQRTPQPLTESP